MAYFLITTTDDGDVYLKKTTPSLVIKELESEIEYLKSTDTLPFLGELPTVLNSLKKMPPCRILIKGEIIIPKSVERVVKYEIE